MIASVYRECDIINTIIYPDAGWKTVCQQQTLLATTHPIKSDVHANAQQECLNTHTHTHGLSVDWRVRVILVVIVTCLHRNKTSKQSSLRFDYIVSTFMRIIYNNHTTDLILKTLLFQTTDVFQYICKSFNDAAVNYYPTTTELTRINISHESNKETHEKYNETWICDIINKVLKYIMSTCT